MIRTCVDAALARWISGMSQQADWRAVSGQKRVLFLAGAIAQDGQVISLG